MRIHEKTSVRFGSLGCCVAVLLLSAAGTVGAAYLPTNIDLVVETVEQAVDQALADMAFAEARPEQGASVLVQAEAEHEANWLVDHVLAQRLLARGFAVTLDSSTAETGSARLSYRVLDLGVTGRSGLWGGRVERRSRVTLALRLSSADDEILQWQNEQTVVTADRVPKREMDLLQTTDFEFARTDLDEQTWGRFVEPVLVSTVLGGLVYLFFSNR